MHIRGCIVSHPLKPSLSFCKGDGNNATLQSWKLTSRILPPFVLSLHHAKFKTTVAADQDFNQGPSLLSHTHLKDRTPSFRLLETKSLLVGIVQGHSGVQGDSLTLGRGDPTLFEFDVQRRGFASCPGGPAMYGSARQRKSALQHSQMAKL